MQRKQHRAVPLTHPLDNLLVRWAELRLNLIREREQEQQALTQGLLLPIRATRRAAMLQRALHRNRQQMLALPL
jgi:hypothetical protein